MALARQTLVLWRHELRSALRERNIVVHTVLIPLFLYPLILWLAYSGMSFVQGETQGFTSRIVLRGLPPAHAALRHRLTAERVEIVERADAEADLRAGTLDALVVFEPAPAPPAGNFRVQVEPLSTVEAIVTGISFLGAGTIFVSGRQSRVKGLTTAASIWVTAAIGIAVGLDRYIIAVGSTVFIYLTLMLIHWTEEHYKPSQSAEQDEEE